MNNRTKIILIAVIGIALLLVGLFLFVPRGSERTVEAPAPPREVTPAPLPPPIPSTIAVQAELPIAEVRQVAASALGDYLRKPIQREDTVKGITIESFVNLMPGTMAMTSAPDSTISVHLPFQFNGWARASKKILGKVLQHREYFTGKATATLTLKLRLDSDWSIRPESELEIVIQEAALHFWGISISMQDIFTQLVEDVVAPKLEELIVKHIARVDVKTRVASIWERLQEPTQVREEPPILLVMEPLEIAAQHLSGNEETLFISLGIRTYIQVLIGDIAASRLKDAPPEPKPLPDLQFVDALETGFHILAPIEVAYTAIEKLAEPHVEKAHDLKGIETHVETLSLYGSGNQLVAGVTFNMPAFDARGQLYLLGTPVYEPTAMTIAVTEFNYALTTQSLLLGFADDIGEGIFPNLRTTVEEKLVFSLEERLTELQEMLARVIENRQIGSYVTLNGTVDSVTPEALYLTQEGLRVPFRLQGSLSCEVHLNSTEPTQ